MAGKNSGRQKNKPTGPIEERIEYVSLSDETRRRYLNYAMSVIQSRALPDVRDGLKPVQRRILYVMFNELRLLPGTQPRKSMAVIGDTLAKFHPHGDVAVYEAMVRLAQDFTMREPLVDGQGNFGSLFGLPPAAARYTEARLTPIAVELMSELRYDTVAMRDNYDGRLQEPVVFPARFPNLLVNGVQGIAVGMATSMPPHNLGEVLKACIHLIDSPDVSIAQLMRFVKGPDFPLGGRIVSDRNQIRQVYETGRGAIKVRGEWKLEEAPKGEKPQIIIHNVPYGVETGPLVASIGDIVASRKIPQLLSVNDETSDEMGLRIVLEIKSNPDAHAVMSYLFKHTALEQNFNVNSTCLVPDEKGVLVPRCLSLLEILQQFLIFRLETVRRRFQYLLAQLEKRIHILDGFALVFNGLDKALKLIRASTGKKDAAEKLMANFPLDAEQTDAILELALYRISTLEIDDILKELKDKQKEATRLRKILASESALWNEIKNEFQQLADGFPSKRKTALGSSEEVTEYDASVYIVKENTNVVLSKDGWVKRVGRLASVDKTRVRDGDEIIDVIPGSTLDHVIFFNSDGIAYTMPIEQIPASSGYGEPLSKHLKLADSTQILCGLTTDARFTPQDAAPPDENTPSPPYLFIATAKGNVLRVSLSAFRAITSKAGRKFCRLVTDDKVIFVGLVPSEATSLFLATRKARIIHFAIDDVPILSGPGKGVRGIKMSPDDLVLGMAFMTRPSDCLRALNDSGKQLTFGQAKYTLSSRGGKGYKTSQRSGFSEILKPPIQLVDWQSLEDNNGKPAH